MRICNLDIWGPRSGKSTSRVMAAVMETVGAHDDRDAAIVARHRAEAEQRAAEDARLRGQLADQTAEVKNRAKVDRAEITALRDDVVATRAEARSEREQLRADHAAEVARITAAADQRRSPDPGLDENSPAEPKCGSEHN